MSKPIKRTAADVTPTLGPTCPVCGEPVTFAEKESGILEQYTDGVGKPGDKRRIPADRAQRRMVPGPSVTTYRPCGHEVPTRAPFRRK